MLQNDDTQSCPRRFVLCVCLCINVCEIVTKNCTPPLPVHTSVRTADKASNVTTVLLMSQCLRVRDKHVISANWVLKGMKNNKRSWTYEPVNKSIAHINKEAKQPKQVLSIIIIIIMGIYDMGYLRTAEVPFADWFIPSLFVRSMKFWVLCLAAYVYIRPVIMISYSKFCFCA